MRIAGFCNTGILLLITTGAFSRHQSKIGRKLLRSRKPPEVSYLNTERQCRMRGDTAKAAQPFAGKALPVQVR